MTKEHRLFLGKCDFNGSGRRNCKAYVTWTFDAGRFSMSGEVWNPRETDIYMGGQCLEELLRLFPANTKLRRMVAIWREWHLNDLTAGSPAQEAWLKANPIPREEYAYPKSHYEVACTKLAAAGLHPDPSYLHNGKPYAYGSAWLKRDIPQDVADEIASWSNGEAKPDAP